MRPRKIVAVIIIVLFTIIWILSIASCAVVDWTSVTTTALYPYTSLTVKIGLWSVCNSGSCVSNSQLNFRNNCGSLLSATGAFSIITIVFAFITSLAYMFTLCNTALSRCWEVTGLVLALLTLLFSILPWTIFLGFSSGNNCASNGTLGSGWVLALVSFLLAIIGAILAIGHCCCCRRSRQGEC
eukprot:RCo049415